VGSLIIEKPRELGYKLMRRPDMTKRLLDDSVKPFVSTPTASLSDALDRLGIRGFMSHEIRPLGKYARIAGPAVTIKDTPATEKMIPLLAIQAIDSALKGSIIVRSVEGTDPRDIGLWGGLMSQAAKVKGIQAAVLDGGSRDLVEAAAMKFPIYARSVVPTTSVGRTKVSAINVPIECGGVTVAPGDVVVADVDGVVVIPKQKLAEVLKLAQEIDKIEKAEVVELRRGHKMTEVIQKYARM
jgi:regulator of RNase E activity RraA